MSLMISKAAIRLTPTAIQLDVTYMELARWIGPLTFAHVVADACATNPIALAVPCHRVVRTDGDLGYYGWGIARKRELIRKEAMA